jgi:hypothetical protein
VSAAAPDLAQLSRDWALRWPDCPPIAHELRHTAGDRWLRFHSLPRAKRYADTEAEYAELLLRHNTVLAELTPSPRFVMTCAWSAGPDPIEREVALVAISPATYWRSLVNRAGVWTHLYVAVAAWKAGALDALLRLVADDVTADVPADLTWLYHPYDGGADVFAPPEQRRRLAARFASWRA